MNIFEYFQFFGLFRFYLLLKKRSLRRFVIYTKNSIFKIEKRFKRLSDLKLNKIAFYSVWVITLLIDAMIIYFSLLGVNFYFK